MTLQTSGAISWSAIQTEFGGSNPIALTEYYGATSNIAASGAIKASMFYGQSALGATLPTSITLADTQIAPENASVGLELFADGTWAGSEAGSANYSGTWKNGGTGSNFDVRLTKSSGSTPTGSAVNTWINLASTAGWYLSETADNFASKALSGTLEIRLAASPFTVLDSSTVSMQATVDV